MLEKVPPRPGPSPSPSPSPGPSPSPSPNQARISPEFAKKLVIKTSVADNGRRSAAGRRLSVALGAKGLQNVAEFAKRASNVEMMDYSEEVNRCASPRAALTLTLTLTLALAPLAHASRPKSHSPHGPRCTPANDLHTRLT